MSLSLLTPDGEVGLVLGVPITGPLATLEQLRVIDNRFEGVVDMTTNKIVNLATPTTGTDAANKAYVDSQIGASWIEDEFTPTNGQVSFTLSQAPIDLDTVTVHVNGVLYDDGADFSVSGAILTWLNTFVLATTDKMIVRYI